MPTIHIIVNALLIGAVAGAGFFLVKTRTGAVAGVCLSVVIAVGGIWLNHRPDLYTQVLPWREGIYYSSFLPLAAALFVVSALYWGRTRGQRIRMGILLCILSVLSLKEHADHWRKPAESYQNMVDKDGICRQSSMDTCSAAALVTLLGQYDIEISEKEAVDLALTKKGHGTMHLGLYRALCIVTEGWKEMSPRVNRWGLGELLAHEKPAIITVGLPKHGNRGEAIAFGEKYDWRPGVLHDVVYLGHDPERDGYIRIGEPDFGLESWPVEHLEYLYYGFAIVLEETS